MQFAMNLLSQGHIMFRFPHLVQNSGNVDIFRTLSRAKWIVTPLSATIFLPWPSFSLVSRFDAICYESAFASSHHVSFPHLVQNSGNVDIFRTLSRAKWIVASLFAPIMLPYPVVWLVSRFDAICYESAFAISHNVPFPHLVQNSGNVDVFRTLSQAKWIVALLSTPILLPLPLYIDW